MYGMWLFEDAFVRTRRPDSCQKLARVLAEKVAPVLVPKFGPKNGYHFATPQ